MKKKNILFVFCCMILMTFMGACGVTKIAETKEVDAASKSTTKKTVYKAITSVKSGKYTYYYNGKAIYRENSKGKKTKLSKFATDGSFTLDGKYIYYCAKSKNVIYRMNKNGKNHKKFKLSVSSIRTVKNSYIYYNNNTGLWRVKTSGKGKTKVLSYSKNYGSVIVGNRIFYTNGKAGKYVEGKEQKLTVAIESVNLKGKDKKKYVTFEGNLSAQIAGDNRYLYVLVHLKEGCEIGMIDTKASEPVYKKLQYYVVEGDRDKMTMEEIEPYSLITVINGNAVFHDSKQLYSMNSDGEVEALAMLPVDEEQGVTLEKQGSYYWLQFYGDDSYGTNFIYDKEWNLVKKLTRKYGDVTDLRIKKHKAYVIFDESEDASGEEKDMTYKIYKLK